MALENLLNEKFSRIDEENKISKNIISYFVGLINSDIEKYKELFSSKIEEGMEKYIKNNSNPNSTKEEIKKIKESYIEESLYQNVKKMVTDLDLLAEESRPLSKGCLKSFYAAEIKTPDVELGFSEYYRISGCSTAKRLTEKGISLINSYRKIIGKDKIN